LIDETGKIFHESVNDMPLGRNVNEYIQYGRCLHPHTGKGVCPANWEAGKEAMVATEKYLPNIWFKLSYSIITVSM
jgi:peroxiredoxin (alkyl hydroperoxide reductase subunit C)